MLTRCSGLQEQQPDDVQMSIGLYRSPSMVQVGPLLSHVLWWTLHDECQASPPMFQKAKVISMEAKAWDKHPSTRIVIDEAPSMVPKVARRDVADYIQILQINV